jgi:hypothetical protein
MITKEQVGTERAPTYEIDSAEALIDKVLQRAGINDTGKVGGAYERLRWLATLARSGVPSGQVAEDARRALVVLDSAHSGPPMSHVAVADARDALARLAAGAQRTEQAEQEAATLRAEVEKLKADCARLREERMRLEAERNVWIERGVLAQRLQQAVEAQLTVCREECAQLRKRSEVTTLELDTLRAQVDRTIRAATAGIRLELRLNQVRAENAEVELAAIRGQARNLSTVAARSDLEVFRRWVVNGDAPPNHPGMLESSPDTSADMPEDDGPCDCDICDEAKIDGMPPPHWTVAEFDAHQRARSKPSIETVNTARGALGLQPLDIAHPCSPTCTHDDARNPGHKERVRQRSEAFVDAADIDQSITRDALMGDGFEKGAEAMRAACWEAVQSQLRILGDGPGCGVWELLRSAIESATP